MGELHIQGLRYKDHRITNKIEVTEELNQYIKSPEMFVEYDADIYANESILNIPLIATILPLAWLSGSDIFVEKLDRDFKEYMDNLQSEFRTTMPLTPFSTEIHVEELVENRIEPEDPERRTGLLFSGGIDSTYSMITNIEKKPNLIMHWGVERTPYPVYREYWEKVKKIYNEFSERIGLKYHLTKTNPHEILHKRRIEHTFYKELYYGTLWERLQHSLVLISLTAPLSISRFDQLIIAASHFPEHTKTIDKNRPHSQRPEADEKIRWADLIVKHDGFVTRNMKAEVIAEYLKNERPHELTLRVCLDRKKAPDVLNCSDCSKCLRTIGQMVLVEFNPMFCGFRVDGSTFERLKTHYIRFGMKESDYNTQKLIPEVIGYDLQGSREFFEWFRDYKPEIKEVWFYRNIYHSLPYNLAKVLDELYSIAGINIHEHNPILPEKLITKLGKDARARTNL